MQVQQIVEQLGIQVITNADLDREVGGGYASDLLSCVMAGARADDIWVTLQAHPNVVAVASLLELSAVVITEGIAPDQETVRKAQEEQVNLLCTDKNTFETVGALTGLGIKGSRAG
jgi:hypothetical protein